MHQQERQVGSYRLQKHLEHGILADAYLATHIPTEKQVIVKVFQETLSEEQRALCMASLRACARLEHPYILRLLDFGEEAHTLFLAVDAPGETQRQRYPQGLPLPLDTIALYVSHIASALQFAHNQDVLHLDLSPERLFVGSDGRIQLDYTNRLLFSVLPTFISADALYTPHEAAGPASDQYALAMIVSEWLSGTIPFMSEGVDQRRILPVPGEPVARIWSRVEPILSRALALDATQRHENVQTFADTFVLALNVGSQAARLKRSLGGRTSAMGVVSVTTRDQHTSGDWHNPFRSGFHFTTHRVQTLAFSPDSTRLAFTCYEPGISVAEVAEPGTLFTYQGHTDAVRAVAWSPDGLTIASMSANETMGDLQIWEVATRKLLSSYHVHPSVSGVQWSPDGRLLAIGGWESTVSIVQPLTGKTVLTYHGHPHMVMSLAWSPDSTRLVSASLSDIQVWAVATGELICTYHGHFGGSNAVAWSPDGTMIASGGNDMTIHIWDAATRAPLFLHRLFSSVITAIGWSPDGKYILTGTRDNMIQVCDVKNGKNVFSYRSHVMRIESMGCTGWSPDMNILALGGDDRCVEVANRVSGKVLLCHAPAALIEEIGQGEVAQGGVITTTETRSMSDGQTTTTTVTTTTVPPSGPLVMHRTTKQRRAVNVWGGEEDVRDMVTYFGHASAVKPLVWSPDGSYIASGGYDGSLHVWDAVTGTTSFIYRGHLDPIVTVAWSPDGTHLASGSLDHTVKIWDLLTGREILTYHGHRNFVQTIVWSPDSTRLASGGEDTTVQVWSATSGETILTYHDHTAAVSSVSWSIDGQRIASGSDDQTVQIWEAATGTPVFVYRHHAAAVRAVAWSPDGKRIASSGVQESIHESDHAASLHIWSVPADPAATIYGQDEHPWKHPTIRSMTWSPDGQMIATPDASHVQIYDASTGEVMAMIMNRQLHQQPLDNIIHIAWSPDGTRIAGGLSNGRVQVWPARAPFNRSSTPHALIT